MMEPAGGARGMETAAIDVAALLVAVSRLDAAPTLTGVLETLTDLAAGQAGRAVLFVAAADGLRGWRAVGFDQPPDVVQAIREPAAGPGLLARAVAARRPQPRPVGPAAAAAGAPPACADLPDDRGALAVPVLIGGEPLIVLYADEVPPVGDLAPAAAPRGWWKDAVTLLARYAGGRLEALTAARAAALASAAAPAGPAWAGAIKTAKPLPWL